MDNRTRLRAHLARLGWSQRRLAAWLTEQGEPVAESTVWGWMAGQCAAHARRCPAWPSLLIERDTNSDTLA